MTDRKPTSVRYTDMSARIEANSEPHGECRLWTGKRDRDGYGCITVWNKERKKPTTLRAHRVSYSATGRALDASMTIDHRCGNRACVNPDHLEPVTMHENLRRAGKYNPDNTCPACGAAIEVASTGRRICRPCSRRRATESHARKRSLRVLAEFANDHDVRWVR